MACGKTESPYGIVVSIHAEALHALRNHYCTMQRINSHGAGTESFG